MYSGGMSEYAHDMEERENLSGMDLCEAWHEEQRRLINEIHEITETQIKVSPPQTESAQPF